jgi:hypothetical protein
MMVFYTLLLPVLKALVFIRHFCREVTVKVVQRLELSRAVALDVAGDPVRQRLRELVAYESAGRNGEDVVELLKRALLGLRHKQEDHAECDDVEAAVETCEQMT